MKIEEITNEELVQNILVWVGVSATSPSTADIKAELLRRLNAGEREYTHWPECNGSRRFPAGDAGHCCSCFNAKHGDPGEPAKPRCPKCDAEMNLTFERVSEHDTGAKAAKKHAVTVSCKGNDEGFHFFHLWSLADFAQFFPAERQDGWDEFRISKLVDAVWKADTPQGNFNDSTHVDYCVRAVIEQIILALPTLPSAPEE